MQDVVGHATMQWVKVGGVVNTGVGWVKVVVDGVGHGKDASWWGGFW